MSRYQKGTHRYPLAVKIDGTVNMIDRQRAVDSFQTRPEVRLFVGQMRAAGTGLTLTASHNVLFAECDFVPAIHSQAEARCILEGAPVLTPNGWQPIETLQLGDLVINRRGQPVPIRDIWHKECRPYHPITDVELVGFPPISTTHDHRFMTDIGWKEAHLLLPGDKIELPKCQHVEELRSIVPDDSIRLPSFFVGAWGMQKNARLRHIPDVIAIDDDFLFLMGYFAGDGYATFGKTNGAVAFAGNLKKKKIALDRIEAWFNRNGFPSRRDVRNNAAYAYVHSKEWALWFRLHFGYLAQGKKLPEFLLTLNERQSRVVLEGLMASDGSHRKLRHEYATVSKTLASHVMRLAINAGYKPTVVLDRQTQSGGQIRGREIVSRQNVHLVSYSTNCVGNYASVRRVCTHNAKRPSGPLRRHPKIYDLTTDDTESFVVGMSVVHNCLRIGQKNHVQCSYIIASNTIEEYVAEILYRKQQEFDAVIDGGRNVDSFNIIQELLRKMRKSFV
jgi:hypothetical protein